MDDPVSRCGGDDRVVLAICRNEAKRRTRSAADYANPTGDLDTAWVVIFILKVGSTELNQPAQADLVGVKLSSDPGCAIEVCVLVLCTHRTSSAESTD